MPEFSVLGYFSGHVLSKTKSVTPNFFCLFVNSISLPFFVASLKKICAWELLGANVLKNSNPREKVAKLSSFWDWWVESVFVSIIVAKYNIFPRANNGRSRENQNISGEAICPRYQRALSGF